MSTGWSRARRSVIAILLPLLVAACGSDKATSPAGRIALSNTQDIFQTQPGRGPTGQLLVDVTNSGTGSITDLTATIMYSRNQPTGWLTATLSQTTVPATLTLQADPGALGVGTYFATVVIAGTGANPRNLPVTLEIVP